MFLSQSNQTGKMADLDEGMGLKRYEGENEMRLCYIPDDGGHGMAINSLRSTRKDIVSEVLRVPSLVSARERQSFSLKIFQENDRKTDVEGQKESRGSK
jgi:hypothetical protein